MDIAYESFVHEMCMEAVSKNATKIQKEILNQCLKESGISDTYKPFRNELDKLIKKNNTKEAIKRTEAYMKSARKCSQLMSQSYSRVKNIKGTFKSNIDSVGDAVSSDLKKFNVSAVPKLMREANFTNEFKHDIEVYEKFANYWGPLLLDELRTNGCSDRALKIFTQYKGANLKAKFKE